jgi:phage terminase small subunit
VIAEASGITPEKILPELARLGFANMQDFLGMTSEDDPYFDLSDLTRDRAAALTGVTV